MAEYNEEFKRKAVRTWRGSGRSVESVAAELGIVPEDLHRWKDTRGHYREPDSSPLPDNIKEAQAEIRRLRVEVASLQENVEILIHNDGRLSIPEDETVAARAMLRRNYTYVAFAHYFEDLLLGAPSIVHDTWNAYMELLSESATAPKYARHALYLADCFIKAVDPLKASTEAHTNLAKLALLRFTWPGFISKSEILTSTEKGKLAKLPLGAGTGKKRIRASENVLGDITDWCIEQLRENAKHRFIECNGSRKYWDFHYVCETRPPLDSQEGVRVWADIGCLILDLNHGPSAKREEARRSHFQAFSLNPQFVLSPAGVAGRVISSLNEFERSAEFVENELYNFGERDKAHRDSALRTESTHTRGTNPKEVWPCILARPDVRQYCDNAFGDPTGKRKYRSVKSDPAIYNQLRRSVRKELCIRLPGVLKTFEM